MTQDQAERKVRIANPGARTTSIATVTQGKPTWSVLATLRDGTQRQYDLARTEDRVLA